MNRNESKPEPYEKVVLLDCARDAVRQLRESVAAMRDATTTGVEIDEDGDPISMFHREQAQ